MLIKNNNVFRFALLLFFIILTTCEKKSIKTSDGTSHMQKQLHNLTKKAEPDVEQSSQSDNIHVKAIGSLEELNTIIENTPGKLLVFDLYADWCMPCKLLAPVYDTIAQAHAEYAAFYRIDVERQFEIASAFNVHSIPLVVFIKDKEIIHSLPGFNQREQYERVISTCGADVPVNECMKKLKEVL